MTSPLLYGKLAAWWPLLSAPEDYREEAETFVAALQDGVAGELNEVLELGSGGGNTASHLKRHVRMTLVDLSSGMIEVSRALNPECEHVVDDMRTVRLERTFDGVFLHDALSYLTSEEDIRATCATVFEHVRAGGAALFVPDWTRETFRPVTSHGGHDGEGRALRYMSWLRDPDPTDTVIDMEMVYLLVEPGRPSRAVHDVHRCGLFPRAVWTGILAEAGFDVRVLSFLHSTFAPQEAREMFLAVRSEG